MSAVSETMVREYFELHGFFVRQHRKYVAPAKKGEEEEIDFFVTNPQAKGGSLPFVLTAADMPAITNAVVVVKGWHTEVFGPAVLAGAPEIFRFVEPASFQQAERAFGSGAPLARILVAPALPVTEEARQQSIELLRSKGIDAVIPFRTILGGLIEHVETSRNYQKSDLLQIIRILKNYDFFKGPQLDLFKPRRARKVKGG